jgi:hypothetical protein
MGPVTDPGLSIDVSGTIAVFPDHWQLTTGHYE